MSVLIVGNASGTNVGASLERAAIARGWECRLCDARAATAGPRVAVTLSWRVLGHRPLHLRGFSRSVVEACRRHQPRVLLTTGQAPLDEASLAEIGRMGITRVNYSTDDPWNATHRASWFLAALSQYDKVFTTRRSNIADFQRQGCPDVSWLPFGYDQDLWMTDVADGAESSQRQESAADVFFAGAAEKYRAECLEALVSAGVRVAVAGDYWKRDAHLRKYCVGHLSAAQLREWTRRTPVALCLVRRANRDGHVMRSFEIPAIGACMAVENTEEHRMIFGADGEAVRYFDSPAEVVGIVKELLGSPALRDSLAAAARDRITGAPNRYADRLQTMTGGLFAASRS